MQKPFLPLVAAAVAAAALCSVPARADSATSATAQADLATDLARIRQATSRFRDINVALSEGYVIAPPGECVSAESEGQPRQLGAMGVHLARIDLLGITGVVPRVNGTGTNTDFTQPTVLVYERRPTASTRWWRSRTWSSRRPGMPRATPRRRAFTATSTTT